MEFDEAQRLENWRKFAAAVVIIGLILGGVKVRNELQMTPAYERWAIAEESIDRYNRAKFLVTNLGPDSKRFIERQMHSPAPICVLDAAVDPVSKKIAFAYIDGSCLEKKFDEGARPE